MYCILSILVTMTTLSTFSSLKSYSYIFSVPLFILTYKLMKLAIFQVFSYSGIGDKGLLRSHACITILFFPGKLFHSYFI